MFAHDPTVTAPSSLTVLKKQKNPPASYKDLKGGPKDEVTERLRNAQQNRCAYCETSIRNNSKVRIEHFHPQSATQSRPKVCQERTGGSSLIQADLAYENMLLCCDGHEGGPQRATTCDVSKGGKDICSHFFNPKQQSTDTLVRVKSDGTVKCLHFPETSEEADTVVTDILRLNNPHLCNTRGQVYVAEMKQVTKKLRENSGRIAATTLRERLATTLENKAQTEPYPSTLLSLADDVRRGSRN
jgi:uncharacterized protein (TIGR02646 family)